MALKMDVTCSRCKKTHSKTFQSVEEAQTFENLEKKRGERMKEIAKFFEGIPEEELPAFMVIGGDGMVHVNLCDPEETEAKRSCKKRVAELVKQAGELEPKAPRKPRAKKAADDVTPPTPEPVKLTQTANTASPAGKSV